MDLREDQKSYCYQFIKAIFQSEKAFKYTKDALKNAMYEAHFNADTNCGAAYAYVFSEYANYLIEFNGLPKTKKSDFIKYAEYDREKLSPEQTTDLSPYISNLKREWKFRRNEKSSKPVGNTKVVSQMAANLAWIISSDLIFVKELHETLSSADFGLANFPQWPFAGIDGLGSESSETGFVLVKDDEIHKIKDIYSYVPLYDENKTERDWLDPFLSDSLPLFGRREALDDLKAFVDRDEAFLTWVVTGPGGSGKTRLISEFVKTRELLFNWDVLFINKFSQDKVFLKDRHHRARPTRGISPSGNDWSNWTPEQQTLLILDQTQAAGEVISAIFERLEYLLTVDIPKVRVLVSQKRFSFDSVATSQDQNWDDTLTLFNNMKAYKRLFHSTEPLDLSYIDENRELLNKIVYHRANVVAHHIYNRKVSRLEVEKSVSTFTKDKDARYPLFAALVGESLGHRGFKNNLDHNQIVRNHLRASKLLPWMKENDQNIGLWMATITAVGTIFPDATLSEVMNASMKNKSVENLDFEIVKQNILRYSHDLNEDIIPRFPDGVVGKNFVLLFIRRIRTTKKFRNIFLTLVTALLNVNPYRSTTCITFFRSLFIILRDEFDSKEKEDDSWKRSWEEIVNVIRPDLLADKSLEKWVFVALLLHMREYAPHGFTSFCLPMSSFPHLSSEHISNLQSNREKVEGVLGLRDYIDFVVDEETVFSFWPKLFPRVSFNLAMMYLNGKPFDFPISRQMRKKIFVIINAAEDKHHNFNPIFGAFGTLNDGIIKPIVKKRRYNNIPFKDITPLMFAARHHGKHEINILIKYGAKKDAVDDFGSTALHYACDEFDLENIKTLCRHKIKINAIDNDGNTPLLVVLSNVMRGGNKHAFFYQYGEADDLVETLLKYGADVHTVNDEGQTALDIAVRKNQAKICEQLLEAGADMYRISSGQRYWNTDGLGTFSSRSPLEMAQRENLTEVLAVMQKYAGQSSQPKIVSTQTS